MASCCDAQGTHNKINDLIETTSIVVKRNQHFDFNLRLGFFTLILSLWHLKFILPKRGIHNRRICYGSYNFRWCFYVLIWIESVFRVVFNVNSENWELRNQKQWLIVTGCSSAYQARFSVLSGTDQVVNFQLLFWLNYLFQLSIVLSAPLRSLRLIPIEHYFVFFYFFWLSSILFLSQSILWHWEFCWFIHCRCSKKGVKWKEKNRFQHASIGLNQAAWIERNYNQRRR